MINHARTLLLNRNGATHMASELGGEFVPADFRAITLPTYIKNVRAALFGADPDLLMQNYRLRQLMTILHATELVEFLTDLDPRITYSTTGTSPFYNELFGITVRKLDDTVGTLHVLGQPDPPDTRGRAINQWKITAVAGSRAQVERQTAPLSSAQYEYDLVDGLGTPIDLPGSLLQFQLSGVTTGETWLVESRARPTDELGSIVEDLKSVGESTITELFGLGTVKQNTEPFRTFYNLWHDHPELSYKLGGLLLALIYRTNEVRSNA